jgi:hypothetical protein
MRRLLVIAFIFLFFSSAGAAQQAPIKCPGKLSAEQVELLVRDVAETRVRAYINTCGLDFSLTVDIENKLRSAGATDDIIKIVSISVHVKTTQPAEKKKGSLSRETEFWQSIRDSNQVEDFGKYLQQFPKGIYRALAEKRIEEIDREARDKAKQAKSDVAYWESIRDSNQVEDFRKYLHQFPDGIYRSLAENRALEIEKETSKKEKQAKRDADFWELIRTSKDPQSFHEYLKLFPEGAYRKLCEQRLLELSNDNPSFLQDKNIRDALVLYFTFDKAEADGKVTDNSSKGNHGQNIGAVWTANGKNGGAFEFLNNGSRILIPNKESIALSQVTLAAWIKTSFHNGLWQPIFSKSGNEGIILRIAGDFQNDHSMRGKLNLWIRGDSTTPTADHKWIMTDNVVADGQWHHVVATYDGAVQQLYIDANLICSVPWKGRIPENNGNLLIGANREDEKEARSFLGTIDEPMVFNRALKPQEIKLLYELKK